MHTIENARKRYPETAFHPLLITEVTKMFGNMRCVAAWDLYREKIVRPLLSGGQYWHPNSHQDRWAPGVLLNTLPTSESNGIPPHNHENLVVAKRPDILEIWDEAELYSALINKAQISVVSAFGLQLIDNKYVDEGTKCPSLGSIRIKRGNARFIESFGRLRLRFLDSESKIYNLPVTSVSLLERFSPKDPQEGTFGVLEANEWLEVNEPTQEIILRLGFARGWAGKEIEPYEPQRCYLQLNGVICPTDNWHIFAGPPRYTLNN